jgi:hypothetical protein
MGDRLLTVIIANGGIPRPTGEVDAIHPPLEVVQWIRVSPVRAAGWASGFRSTALSVFLKPLRSLLLFLTDSIFLIFLPTNPPGDYVRKWRSKVERNKAMYHSLDALSSLFRLQDDMKS